MKKIKIKISNFPKDLPSSFAEHLDENMYLITFANIYSYIT